MTFNHLRMALARKRKKVASKTLAELVGVSPVTISRIEKGNNDPEPATAAAIAKELGFPIGFFYDDDIDALSTEAASFRSLTTMTAKEKDAALSAGSLAYLLSDWVNVRFNLPNVDLPNLQYEGDAETSAKILRQHWGLGETPVSNMIKLMESKGIRVFSLAENTKNVDAFSCWRDSTPYVFLNIYKSAERSRFDAAHELGHLILHKHGGPHDHSCAASTGREAEREADAFAAAFLMPKEDITSRIPNVQSLDQVVLAKKRWGVSVAALAYRLKTLNVITEWQHRTFCIQINQRGYRYSEPNGLPREESVVWKEVFSSLWKDRLTKGHVAQELNLPLEELENLVWGLTHNSPMPENRKLRAIDNKDII
ncbi:MAG: ImmA/IrrE family metallo-endopeptidase [Alphaproteobacteria bacterium]|nr:ImmA/IrrE family metallo-endopeptidase [Alphaproteobacteria bacterium]